MYMYVFFLLFYSRFQYVTDYLLHTLISNKLLRIVDEDQLYDDIFRSYPIFSLSVNVKFRP
jgi:hypothetical protein